MFRRSLLSISALALMSVAPLAQAQNYFTNNATINYTIFDNAYVGYANLDDLLSRKQPTSPTVNLVTGGSVRGYLEAFNSSTVNVSGGSIAGDLETFGSNRVNVSGGSIGGSLQARDSGVLNFFGRGLVAPLVDPNYSGGVYSRYALSGKLLDGTVLTNKDLFVQKWCECPLHSHQHSRTKFARDRTDWGGSGCFDVAASEINPEMNFRSQ